MAKCSIHMFMRPDLSEFSEQGPKSCAWHMCVAPAHSFHHILELVVSACGCNQSEATLNRRTFRNVKYSCELDLLSRISSHCIQIMGCQGMAS